MKEKPGKSMGPSKAEVHPLSTKKRWFFRVILLFLAPLIGVGGLEGILRVMDYGAPTSFVIEDAGGRYYRENPRFAWQFHSPNTQLRPQPFLIPKTKPDSVLRIVVLGESAAAGTPEPAYGFARILERLLQFEFPDQQFEIVNAAMRGINSHVIRHIARDTLRLEPDLCIVYMGNNEIVGLHGPSPEGFNLAEYPRLLLAQQAVRSSRAGQWIWNVFQLHRGKEAEKAEQDMEFFRKHRLAFDAPERQAVYRNFELNLRAVLKTFLEKNVPVLLSTVAANLKDCPPLASLHRTVLDQESLNTWRKHYQEGVDSQSANEWDRALVHLRLAESLDDHYAELNYRMAQCWNRQHKPDKALAYYQKACDRDALPFRSDGPVNRIIRNAGSSFQSPHLTVLDLREGFNRMNEEDPQGCTIPGNDLLYDHVHFNFNGDYQAAKAMFLAVLPTIQTLLGKPKRTPDAVLSKTKCALRMGLTTVNEVQMYSSIVDVLKRPPFLDQLNHDRRVEQMQQKLDAYFSRFTQRDIESGEIVFERAIQQSEPDWQLHYNFGLFYITLKQFEKAAEQLQKAADIMPHHMPIRLMLANTRMRQNEPMRAIEILREIRRLDPEFKPAVDALKQLKAL